uniref:uncharacterized protein LOC105353249 n=1 Tax=Fragaria vesca subsp. vesca TaxID=101020 RepID=UPI0005C866E3|nr:PREDICTED: uncharacterized protein LOC105353249 [Fragaria vesca subsp. vesca]
MAFFKSFKKGTITILEDIDGVQSDGTTLSTYPSLIGPLVVETSGYDDSSHIPQWTHKVSRQLATFKPTKSINEKRSSDVWILKSAHHDQTIPQTPFVLLNDRMSNSSVKWNGFRTNGFLRTLVPPYEHPSYISWRNVVGEFYDKVVPPIEEFSTECEESKPLIPKSCEYLFLAYHKLCKGNRGQKVKITSWICYWYKGSMKYKRPPAKSTRNKKDAPPSTHNPTGEIPEAQDGAENDLWPFVDVEVDDGDMKSTHLAAFYACWLCLFVFPIDDTSLIRPSVFKVASNMAKGCQYSLVVPVLANIYQGLNEISASNDPRNCSAALPFHYVYAWLAEYFDTHFFNSLPEDLRPFMIHYSGAFAAKHFEDTQARSLFNACDKVEIDRLALRRKEPTEIADREDTTHANFVFLVYVPGNFKKRDVRTITLLLMYWHWANLVRREITNTATLPPNNTRKEYMVTRDYVEWWSKVYHLTSKKPATVTPVGGSPPKLLKLKEDKIVTRTTPPRQNVVPCGVERNNSPHISPIKALPPSNTRPTQPPQLLEGNGDSSDPHVGGSRLKLKLKGIEAPAKRSSESSSSGNVNFKRLRIELDLGSTFFDPDNEFPLNTDFLGDVPGSPLSTPRHVQLEGHPLFEDEACSDAIRVPSTEVLKAHSISKDVTCNDQNELQQVGHKDLYATETSPKPLNKMALSEVTHGAADVVDTSQGLRKIRMQAASQVCEQIEGIITNYSLRTILSKKGDIDELIDELQIYGVDPSSVKDKVDLLMASATQYNAARLACSHKALTGSSDHHLTHAESNIAKLTKLRQANDNRQTAIEALENLKKEQQWLEQIISSSDATLLRHDKQLADFENEKARIKETMEVIAEELEKVKKLGDVFEEQCNSFKGLTWM